MTIKHLDQIKGHPASDQYVEHFAETVLDMLAHEHRPEGISVDLYCTNLAAYMGERIAPLLVRLRESEAALRELLAAPGETVEQVPDVDLPDGWAAERALGRLDIHHLIHEPCRFRSFVPFDLVADAGNVRRLISAHECK